MHNARGLYCNDLQIAVKLQVHLPLKFDIDAKISVLQSSDYPFIGRHWMAKVYKVDTQMLQILLCG